MRDLRWLAGLGLTIGLLILNAVPSVARAAPSPLRGGAFVLTATDAGSGYAPTFTGNGTLGVRVPAAGQGYAPGTVPAQSELAGFYAQPPGGVQQRANIPTWSTLTFTDGGQTFSPTAGATSGWRQSIDLHTGIVSTSARWTAPDGHVTDISYQLLTDRARQFVGLVSLRLTPQWSGTATVTDAIDGTPATLTAQVAKGWVPSARRDWVTVRTQGTGITAGLASQLVTSANVAATTTEIDQSTEQSVGQQLAFPVIAGDTYTITKFVGVQSSQDTADPAAGAQTQAAAAVATGLRKLVRGNDSAWAALWKGRIDVLGNPVLAGDVNASEFYLWSSTRAGVNWSISPAGLSSNGYDGHIFWDAETWMYPSLLAQHPDLAAGIDAYRHQRLLRAEQHARASGYRGARFPWESALDGTEQIPPPVTVNSEGLYEQHITADIALAQWQYYLASGDKLWLAQRGWPVLSQTAAFWASRAVKAADGRFHIDGVTGPDEENPDVNDEAYTNVSAKTTLEIAIRAAGALGVGFPARWLQIASRLIVPRRGAPAIHPEFSGYGGQLVKQADVTLLQYPWSYPMAPRVAQNDINYYVPRTDPTGPSMSDAVNSIDTSALGTPGCASYVFTQRSYQPFIRDVFDQFSETKTGGAFTFMTGIGGFLQEFLYGYSGLRWGAGSVSLAPSLSGGLGGIVLSDVAWHGRRFTVAIGARTTTFTLLSGAPLPLSTPAVSLLIRRGHPYRFPTARPDLEASADVVRCGRVSASSAQPGAPALAAVDGSPATDWQPGSLPATLTAAVRPSRRNPRIGHVTVLWGRQWPPAPGANIPPPPTPVTLRRASSYSLQLSADGSHWRTVATVSGVTTGATDELRFAPVTARYVRVAITAATGSAAPLLQELTVSR